MSTPTVVSMQNAIWPRDSLVVALRVSLGCLVALLLGWGLSYVWMIRAGMLRGIVHELLMLSLALIVLVRVGVEGVRWWCADTHDQVVKARHRMAGALLYASSIYCLLHACHYVTWFVIWMGASNT